MHFQGNYDNVVKFDAPKSLRKDAVPAEHLEPFEIPMIGFSDRQDIVIQQRNEEGYFTNRYSSF